MIKRKAFLARYKPSTEAYRKKMAGYANKCRLRDWKRAMEIKVQELFDAAYEHFDDKTQAEFWLATPKLLLNFNVPVEVPVEAIELLKRMK